MGPVVFSKINYELMTVPERLTALELCILSCHAYALEQPIIGSMFAKHSPLLERFPLGSRKDPLARAFFSSSLEIGIIYNRLMLAFLGVAATSHGLIPASPRTDDVTLTDFSLPPVAPIDIVTILPGVHPSMLDNCFRHVWQCASKGFAHFTQVGGQVSVGELALASYALTKLLEKYFFDPLKTDRPATILPKTIVPDQNWVSGGPWLY